MKHFSIRLLDFSYKGVIDVREFIGWKQLLLAMRTKHGTEIRMKKVRLKKWMVTKKWIRNPVNLV